MIIGTAGHIDHGKTALVRALTGVETDRLKEEQARGITIELGFAYWKSEAGTLGFIDVPGHERLIHTMLAGASGIDLALLVIAADDGIMPQTREHLALLDLLGIARGIVALTKADLVDAARLAALEGEIEALLEGTTLEGAPLHPVSSLTGQGIEGLRAALVQTARQHQARAASGRFRLAVDRSFSLKGAGTVVTGTVLSGEARLEDALVVSPSGLPVRLRALHVQNEKATVARAGDRAALNLAGDGVTREAVSRGDMVLAPALHAPTARIDATLRVLLGARALTTWQPVRLHHASTEVGAHLVPLSGEALAPGEEGLVQLVLERPIAAATGDAYVIRDASAQHTLGGGRLLDLRPPQRKRRTPERLAQLDALRAPRPEDQLIALLALPPYHLDLVAFARDAALAEAAPLAMAARLNLVTLAAEGAIIAFHPAAWSRYGEDLVAFLTRFHDANPDRAGIGQEQLRLGVAPVLARSAFKAAVAALVSAGTLVREGAWLRLPGRELRLSEEDEALWALIAPHLAGEQRFRPPRVRDFVGITGASEPVVRALMKRLARLGQVDEVAHDHFFNRDVVAQLVALARALSEAAPDRQFNAAAFRDRVEAECPGMGRKVAIQVLEFLDRHGVTLRRGDLRRINPQRLDLFVPLGHNG